MEDEVTVMRLGDGSVGTFLPCQHKDQSLIVKTHITKLDIVLCDFNTNTKDAKTS